MSANFLSSKIRKLCSDASICNLAVTLGSQSSRISMCVFASRLISTGAGYKQRVICLYETHVWCDGLDDVEEVLRPSDIDTNSKVRFFRIHAPK